jgi:hypothetical protein
MKDEVFFLNTDFSDCNLNEVKQLLINNGWIINIFNNDVFVYESKEDFEMEDLMCSEGGETSDEAFRKCLFSIQDYYNRMK